jgi:cytochrome c oxidase subunit 2
MRVARGAGRVGPWALAAVLVVAVRTGLAGESPRTIQVTASRFKFEPAVIEVQQGEAVSLVLHSADTTHGLAIPAYRVKVTIPKGGDAVTVGFVADRPGHFPFECSEYCGSGHKQMKGELVVVERTS